MSSVLLRGLLVAMFLALSTAFIISQNLHRERILIVNGADPASGFTRRVDFGLRRVFRNVENKTIRWDYMGTEAAADLTTEARLGEVERRRVEKFAPTVIIAVGDDALEYIGKVFADRPGVSVVYSAISGNISRYGFTGTSNVTGITMSTPYAAARDTLIAANESRRTHPIQRIFHVTVDRAATNAGNKESGVSIGRRCDWSAVAPSPHSTTGRRRRPRRFGVRCDRYWPARRAAAVESRSVTGKRSRDSTMDRNALLDSSAWLRRIVR
jgi:hypothetical protein